MPNTTSPSEEPRRIIFDCDCGSDDAIALYLLLLAETKGQVKIEMIVCTRGNTSLHNVCKNIVRLLEVANRTDIPVYKGSHETLLPKTCAVDYFHGIDGFGDLKHANEPDISIIRNEPAFLAMHQVIVANPKQITMICVGPLTNLALLMRIYENVASQLKDIYIMGGNHKGVGNVSQAAEFNFHLDPEAAHIVMQCAESPIHLLTWECCMETEIPMTWRMETLGAKGGPIWQLIDKVERAIYKDMSENWMPCDSFLVAALLHPEIITKQTMRHVDVELAGRLTRGQVAIDHMNKKLPNVNIIEQIDYELYQKIIYIAHTQI